MKHIALSIDEMRYLEELGLDTSDAAMVWKYTEDDYELEVMDEFWKGNLTNFGKDKVIPAYILQDILQYFNELCGFEDFEYRIYYNKIDDIYSIRIENPYHNEAGDTLLECAFKTLVWCIENNYIKTNK